MYIRIDATTEAKRELVKKTGPDSFDVSVREKPERNMANRRILELVRCEFGGTGVMVKIISGHRSPRKIISVEMVSR